MADHNEWGIEDIGNPDEGEVTRVTPACFERSRVRLQAEQILLGMVEHSKRREAERLLRIIKANV